MQLRRTPPGILGFLAAGSALADDPDRIRSALDGAKAGPHVPVGELVVIVHRAHVRPTAGEGRKIPVRVQAAARAAHVPALVLRREGLTSPRLVRIGVVGENDLEWLNVLRAQRAQRALEALGAIAGDEGDAD